MTNYKARLKEFENHLQSEVININEFRKICFSGCPHEYSIRAKCWKVLLNYLPLRTSEWGSHLAKQRKVFSDFMNEIIIEPGRKRSNCKKSDVTHDDHPLNPNPEGQWSQYFKDNDMLVQIDKDCRRLCPDLAFFQSPTKYPNKILVSDSNIETLRIRVEHSVLKAQNICKSRSGMTTADVRRLRTWSSDFVVLEAGQEAHWEVVERILFIYGKLNPGQGYVQGMNEILGPIYFIMASDSDESHQEFAEADAFWCFTNLMSEIRDNFIKSLDESDCGIGYLMQRLMETLKACDTPVWSQLHQQDVRPQFYAFRWLTLLLSQEFPLPDVLRVWDSILSDLYVNKFNCLISVCCAMILLIRDDILKGDFSQNMKLLQNYPAIDIHRILGKAVEIIIR